MEIFYITTIILILLSIFLLMGQFIRSKIAREKKLREEIKFISEFAGNYFLEHQILESRIESYLSEIDILKADQKDMSDSWSKMLFQNNTLNVQVDSYKRDIEDLKKELENARNMPQGFVYTSYWPV